MSKDETVEDAMERYEKEWWLEVPSFAEMKDIMKKELSSVYEAGRKAQREELREVLENLELYTRGSARNKDEEMKHDLLEEISNDILAKAKKEILQALNE